MGHKVGKRKVNVCCHVPEARLDHAGQVPRKAITTRGPRKSAPKTMTGRDNLRRAVELKHGSELL